MSVHRLSMLRSFLAAALLTGVLAPSAAAEIVGVYRENTSGSQKHYLSIDTSTGAFTNQATQTFSAANAYNFGYSKFNNTIYGAVSESGTQFTSFNVTTGATGISPTLNTASIYTQFNMFKPDRDTGKLYAIMRDPIGLGDAIGSVNFATGEVTPIGTPFDNGGFTFPLAGDFDSTDDRFVFISQDPGNSNAISFFSVSAIAGGANIAVISGTTPSALAYDVSSDRFYGLSVGGGNIQLLNVNETTGVTSNIGSTFTLATWDQDFTIDPATGMGYLTGRTAAMGSTERALFAIGLADGSVSQSANFDFATLDLANNPNALVAVSSAPGDYNGDGIVNAADYVVWRKGLDATYTQDDYNVWRANFGQSVAGPSIPGDFNNNSIVDAADYVVWRKTGINGQQGYNDWRSHFGQTAGSAAAIPSANSLSAAVPEPPTFMLLVFATPGWYLRRRWAA
jgi:hypothetical protein